MIPLAGFVEATEQLDFNIKSRSITLSAEGIL
jgi:hypothetical protein